MKKIKVALCDDMKPYCHYLERVFSREKDIEVVGMAHNAKDCLKMIKSVQPDILLLDVQMEKYDSGAEIIPELLSASPETKILMLTVHHEDDLIFKSFVYGAIDYLSKSSEDEEILDIIRKVYHNNARLSPEIAQAIINESTKIKQQNASLLYIVSIMSKLTTSEFKILNDLCTGLSYKDIAKKRFVEEITIRSQISRITKKFNVRNINDVIKTMNELHFFDLVDL